MTIENSAASISEPGDASHSAVEKLVSLPVSGKHCSPLAEEMSWITDYSLYVDTTKLPDVMKDN